MGGLSRRACWAMHGMILVHRNMADPVMQRVEGEEEGDVYFDQLLDAARTRKRVDILACLLFLVIRHRFKDGNSYHNW